MSIFSLLTVFVATIAWFAMNKDVGASGMTLRVNNEGNVLSMLTIHRCNLSASTTSDLVFYSEPSVTVSSTGISTASVTMDNYSDLNKTQPILLLFSLNEGTKEADITVTAKSDNQNYVSTITEDNISAFPFSTAVRFKSASYTNSSFPFDSVSISALTQVTSFVTIENNSYAGYDSQINLFAGSDANKIVKYVAVIMDYYPEAREVLLTNNVGVDILAQSNNNAIDFYCDWIVEI